MSGDRMHLQILVPFEVFLDDGGVRQIIAESPQGCFGLLPHRRDCVAAIVPGILSYETDGSEPVHVAVDEGVLVKHEQRVRVSVRRAMSGTDLAALRDAVEREFLTLDEHERGTRAVIARLEAGVIRQFVELQHG
jgi:F-type H+-transporting ATPase subunit epsilon